MGGREVPFNERGVLDDIKSKQLGYGEKPDYIGVAATLNFVRSEKLWYEACASEGCQKKVVQNTDGAESASKVNLNFLGSYPWHSRRVSRRSRVPRRHVDVREVQQHECGMSKTLHRELHLH